MMRLQLSHKDSRIQDFVSAQFSFKFLDPAVLLLHFRRNLLLALALGHAPQAPLLFDNCGVWIRWRLIALQEDAVVRAQLRAKVEKAIFIRSCAREKKWP